MISVAPQTLPIFVSGLAIMYCGPIPIMITGMGLTLVRPGRRETMHTPQHTFVVDGSIVAPPVRVSDRPHVRVLSPHRGSSLTCLYMLIYFTCPCFLLVVFSHIIRTCSCAPFAQRICATYDIDFKEHMDVITAMTMSAVGFSMGELSPTDGPGC